MARRRSLSASGNTKTRISAGGRRAETVSALHNLLGPNLHYAELFCETTINRFLHKNGTFHWKKRIDTFRGTAARLAKAGRCGHAAVPSVSSGGVQDALRHACRKVDHPVTDGILREISTPDAQATAAVEVPNEGLLQELELILGRLQDLETRTLDALDCDVQAMWQYHDVRQMVVVCAAGGDGREVIANDERSRWGVAVDLHFRRSDGSSIRIERNHGTSRTPTEADWNTFEQAVLAARYLLPDLENAAKISAGEYEVIFQAGCSGVLFHETVGHILEEANLYQCRDRWDLYPGRQIGPRFVSIDDDATIPGLFGSRSIDDVGLASRSIPLLREGILMESLQQDNLLCQGTGVTPCAYRQDYRYPPMGRMSNTIVRPEPYKPADMVHDTDQGLYVAKIGEGSVNPDQMTFSLYVLEGRLIERGRQTTSLRPFALEGSVIDLITNIRGLADEPASLAMYCQSHGVIAPVSVSAPTCLVAPLYARPLNQKEMLALTAVPNIHEADTV